MKTIKKLIPFILTLLIIMPLTLTLAKDKNPPCKDENKKTNPPSITKVDEKDYTDEIKNYIEENKYKAKIKSMETKSGNYIIITMGEKPTGGFSIDFKNVKEKEIQVSLDIYFNSPAKDAFVTQQITYPVLVLKRNTFKEVKIRITTDKGKTFSKEYTIPQVKNTNYTKELEKFIEENKTKRGIRTIQVSSKTYIVVFMGKVPTGGYSLEIKGQKENKGTVFVDLIFKKPAKDAMLSQVETYPYIVLEKDACKKLRIRVKDEKFKHMIIHKLIK